MKVSEITDQTEWTNFFNDSGSPSFLQAWEWGEVQQRIGYTPMRLGIYKQAGAKKPVAIAQVLKVKAKRGKFLFIPHGPVFLEEPQKETLESVLTSLTNNLRAATKKEQFAFIRLALGMENSQEHTDALSNSGYKKAPIYMHAERMWILPIGDKSEDELLSDMRKTTRYSIKKAAREGVTIEERTDAAAVDDFLDIYQKTAEREHFAPFSEDFIRAEFEEFLKTKSAIFLFAKRDDEYMAAALIIFTKSTAFYHQGASIHSKIPAPYLLQWEAIRRAKSRGCQIYNFWGILQEGRTPRSWAGLTLFKKGFSGRQIEFVPTADFLYSKRYYLTSAYERLLAWRRGV